MPLSSTPNDEPSQEKMPIIINSVFTSNVNTEQSGDAAVTIESSFSYREYPVSLIVKNSVFERNVGGFSSAIRWFGIHLEIEDTVFRDNRSLYGATIEFEHSA